MIIGVPYDDYIRGRAIWLEEEIDDFFKRGGMNPFEIDEGEDPCQPRFGMGVYVIHLIRTIQSLGWMTIHIKNRGIMRCMIIELYR